MTFDSPQREGPHQEPCEQSESPLAQTPERVAAENLLSIAAQGGSETSGDSFNAPSPTANRSSRWEELLDRASEKLNPILVKEARQAMKSREFLFTFGLLLLCGWGWSLIGIQYFSPDIYYAATGHKMLMGYFVVLAFPLLVVVPFSAFRSLANERDDGTYELLSITTLKSRRIIGGKLSSAVLQMLVYLSALSPCIAFTYLLRGLDIVTIVVILGAVFLASVLFSTAALLCAALSRNRHWQVAWMMLLILGLGVLFFISLWAVAFVLFALGAMPYDYPGFWIGIAVVLTVYLSYFVLTYLAAAARLAFPSENRSTRLRVVMLIQQLLLIGWFAWLWLVSRDDDAFFPYFILGGIHWLLMGSLMVGESSSLSQRVRRTLPQSLLGRGLGTWFNPGPGTGYMFAVANLFVLVMLALFAAWISMLTGWPGAPRSSQVFALGLLILCYVTTYLGITRLITLGIGRLTLVQPIGGLALVLVLVILGALIPWSLQMALGDQFGYDYTVLQTPNVFWTLVEIEDDRQFLTNQPGTLLLMLVTSMTVFTINLIPIATEVRDHVRKETPQRVQEEEALLHPERQQAPARPRSPWDEDVAVESGG